MSFYSIAKYIQEYYPEYYSIQEYPVNPCITIRRVAEPYGLLGNFARCSMNVDGITFKSVEQLFQCMKFQDADSILSVYTASQPKFTAKHWERTNRRADWGTMIVDAMKFCLNTKYQQVEEFRLLLQSTQGKYIVEDQTAFPKKQADTWGVKLQEDYYVGPNLLGRLLMELRESQSLSFHLPENAFQFIEIIKALNLPLQGKPNTRL